MDTASEALSRLFWPRVVQPGDRWGQRTDHYAEIVTIHA